MDYQAQRIQDNQKLLLKLLDLHIGSYYPLRKWLGISYKGKIDDISHLSFGYNTRYFKKGKKWYKQQTRVYQQPDLGYKLNLLLDKIPQLSLLPALLQPAYRLGALAFFFLTQTTYQPSSYDTKLEQHYPDTAGGTDSYMRSGDLTDWKMRPLLKFNLSDIADGATFSEGTLSLYCYDGATTSSAPVVMYKCTRNWGETTATWNKYDGTNLWTTAGGDWSTTYSVSTNVSSYNAWYSWNSKDVIQDSWNNWSKIINVILVQGNNIDSKFYYSREYTTDPSLRPKLTVTYTVPANFFPFF